MFGYADGDGDDDEDGDGGDGEDGDGGDGEGEGDGDDDESFSNRIEGFKQKKRKKKGKVNSRLQGKKALDSLEPLMQQAEGMIGVLTKTNALKRMEGLVSKINTLTG